MKTMEKHQLNQEHHKNEDDYNTVSLKEFIIEKFIYIEKSIEMLRITNEKCFDGLNEIRQILQDQSNTFLTRTEYEPKHEILNNKINGVQNKISDLLPRKEFEPKYETLDVKIGAISRIVYIGLGAVMVLDIFLKFIKL
jgi:hypothetical protein